MSIPSIDPALLAKLADPAVASMLKQLLASDEDGQVAFAPFYMNKHGKVTKGHEELELQRNELGLTPIYAEEALELKLITKSEYQKMKGEPKSDSDSELDNKAKEESELQSLKAKAKELKIPNWHLYGADRLKGEIKKAELKAKKEEDGEA
ncbi:hypothetical protein DMW20_11805 [Vibrio parahaemolyticus]|nr:hypothetical protein [Vibrio parahaemolyticus]